MVGKQFGLTNIRLHKNKSDGQYKKTADNTLFKKYYPEFKFKSFEEGIKDTCDFFKSNYDSVRK